MTEAQRIVANAIKAGLIIPPQPEPTAFDKRVAKMREERIAKLPPAVKKSRYYIPPFISSISI